MSLVDYPLFSWVVVIHSLHVSSFLEAHHQGIILPVQSTLWYIVFVVALPFYTRKHKNQRRFSYLSLHEVAKRSLEKKLRLNLQTRKIWKDTLLLRYCQQPCGLRYDAV